MTFQQFQDMTWRIANSRQGNEPCEVQYWRTKPSSWPYGILGITICDEYVLATFGDLTIEIVRADRLAQLLEGTTSWQRLLAPDLEIRGTDWPSSVEK